MISTYGINNLKYCIRRPLSVHINSKLPSDRVYIFSLKVEFVPLLALLKTNPLPRCCFFVGFFFFGGGGGEFFNATWLWVHGQGFVLPRALFVLLSFIFGDTG